MAQVTGLTASDSGLGSMHWSGSAIDDQGYSVFSSRDSAPAIAVDWNSYHDYTSLVDLLQQFNSTYPTLIDVFSIGKTWQNREVYCIRITNESNSNPDKQQIFIVAEHHAREVITQEAALYFVWFLVSNYGTETVNIQSLLDSKEIYVIPCLNPDGMEVALTYNPYQRKNMHPIDDDGDGFVDEDVVKDFDGDGVFESFGVDVNLGTVENPLWWTGDQAVEGNATGGDGIYPGFVSDNPGGVDLNRNYDYHFNDTFEMSSNSTNPRVEDYKGSAPFSEPETRALKELVESHNFAFALSLHSGSQILLRPWDYETDTSSLGANYSLFNMFGGVLEAVSGYPYLMGEGNIGYNCSGCFDDWMYGARGIPAMTCEIYRGSTYGYWYMDDTRYIDWGVWGLFNPTGSMIELVCINTLRMLLQVSSISSYSSYRITSSLQLPIVFNDGSCSLNITWSYSSPVDTAVASYTYMPYAIPLDPNMSPVGRLFSLLVNNPISTGVLLSFGYNPQELISKNIGEAEIAVFVRSPLTSGWVRLSTYGQDAERHIITVTSYITGNLPYEFLIASVSTPPQANVMPLLIILTLVIVTGTATAALYVYFHYSRKVEREI